MKSDTFEDTPNISLPICENSSKWEAHDSHSMPLLLTFDSSHLIAGNGLLLIKIFSFLQKWKNASPRPHTWYLIMLHEDVAHPTCWTPLLPWQPWVSKRPRRGTQATRSFKKPLNAQGPAVTNKKLKHLKGSLTKDPAESYRDCWPIETARKGIGVILNHSPAATHYAAMEATFDVGIRMMLRVGTSRSFLVSHPGSLLDVTYFGR